MDCSKLIDYGSLYNLKMNPAFPLMLSAVPRIQLVSATLVLGLVVLDCSLLVSSSHASLGVLYSSCFMGVSLISWTIASSSAWVRFVERGFLGQVAADPAVPVLVGAALPGAVGVGEVGGHAQGLVDQLVAGGLGPVVPGPVDARPGRQVPADQTGRFPDAQTLLAMQPLDPDPLVRGQVRITCTHECNTSSWNLDTSNPRQVLHFYLEPAIGFYKSPCVRNIVQEWLYIAVFSIFDAVGH